MDGMDETIQFISFRDVILTVKSKLLGADLDDTIHWIKKNFYPVNLCYYHKYRDISPTLFVRTPDGEMNPSKPGMTDYLLDIIKETPYFFDFNCYDSHVFNLKEINSFFSTQGVDLCFQESKVKNHSLDAHSKNRKLKSENQHILFLMEFRKDDPLALAIEIRNKDWAGYIYDDKATRANQESIIADLKSRGLSTKQAECIELVACPIKR